MDPVQMTIIGWLVAIIGAVIAGLIIASIKGAKQHNEDVKEKLSAIDTTLQLQNQKYDSVLEKITHTGDQLNKVFTIINRHGRAIVELQTLLRIKTDENEH